MQVTEKNIIIKKRKVMREKEKESDRERRKTQQNMAD